VMFERGHHRVTTEEQFLTAQQSTPSLRFRHSRSGA
jgi:hypothetical protein